MATVRQQKIFWGVFIALFAITLTLPLLPVRKGNVSLGLFPLGWTYMVAWDHPTATTILQAVAIFAIQASMSACGAAYVSRLVDRGKLGQ